MQIEFFSAGCRLCEQALQLIRQTLPDLDLEVHLASE
jgi:hypothetical protein